MDAGGIGLRTAFARQYRIGILSRRIRRHSFVSVINKLAAIGRKAWTTSPQEFVRLATKRISGQRGLAVEDILRSPKYLRPQRFQDFLTRYEAILERAAGWQRLDFAGAAVLEIGCGPLLGFGPLALFRGCASYTAIEPYFDATLIASEAIRNAYFLPLFKDLSAIYGERMTYDAFLGRLQKDTRVLRVPIHTATNEGQRRFDAVLSNSCLEHLDPLAESIAHLKTLCSDDARFLHLVDFGNHRTSANPFSGIYSNLPHDYRRKYGRGINLARPPDLLRLFRENGFGAELQPYYWSREHYAEHMLPYWKERYSDSDLFLKTAIVFGSGSTAVTPR